MNKVAILGAGFMGSAMAWPLSDRGYDVRLVGTHLDQDIIASCRRKNWHPKLERPLPARVKPYPIEELPQALEGVELIIQGVSSAGVRWAAERLTPYLDSRVPVLAVTKGLALDEAGLLQVLPDYFNSQLPDDIRGRIPLAAIGGPCIAGELAGGRNTCVVFASRDEILLRRLASLLQTEYYHVWISSDLIGVEICTALKNAFVLGIALSMGILEASGGPDAAQAHMHNLAAALFAEAAHEMEQIVLAAGGDRRSVCSLPGVGDMYVTAQGGRTLRLGTLLGRGVPIAEALRQLQGLTLESVETLRVMHKALPVLERAGKVRVDEVPLLWHLCQIVGEGVPVDIPWDRFFGGSQRARH